MLIISNQEMDQVSHSFLKLDVLPSLRLSHTNSVITNPNRAVLRGKELTGRRRNGFLRLIGHYTQAAM